MSEWVLITGASAGIGAEMARIWAARGSDLILVARRRDRLEALRNELSFRSVEIEEVDLAQPGAARTLHDRLAERGRAVDVLVNNAGFGLVGPFLEKDLAEQSEMVRLNVVALTELCHLFGKDMAARGSGRILNVSSLAAFQAGPFTNVYYATKAYVQSFSEALREELKSTGVTVTTLCPGPVSTEFQQRAGIAMRLPGPLVQAAEPVARLAVECTMRGDATVYTSWKVALLSRISRLLPRTTVASLTGRLGRRRQRA